MRDFLRVIGAVLFVVGGLVAFIAGSILYMSAIIHVAQAAGVPGVIGFGLLTGAVGVATLLVGEKVFE